jgi:hypothetical protein
MSTLSVACINYSHSLLFLTSKYLISMIINWEGHCNFWQRLEKEMAINANNLHVSLYLITLERYIQFLYYLVYAHGAVSLSHFKCLQWVLKKKRNMRKG